MNIEGLKTQSSESVLPKGNEWNFDKRNGPIDPSIYTKEIKDLESTPEAMQILIGQVNRSYINRPWKFESLLIGKPEGRSFALIYTNPTEELITKNILMPTFVAGNRMKGDRELNPYGIESGLQGTNLLVKSTFIGYTSVEIMEPRGFLKKSHKAVTYYQMGVGYIILNLGSVERRIFLIDSQIHAIEEMAREQIAAQLAKREELTKQLTTPVKLID